MPEAGLRYQYGVCEELHNSDTTANVSTSLSSFGQVKNENHWRLTGCSRRISGR